MQPLPSRVEGFYEKYPTFRSYRERNKGMELGKCFVFYFALKCPEEDVVQLLSTRRDDLALKQIMENETWRGLWNDQFCNGG